jgi:hypothetical protein
MAPNPRVYVQQQKILNVSKNEITFLNSQHESESKNSIPYRFASFLQNVHAKIRRITLWLKAWRGCDHVTKTRGVSCLLNPEFMLQQAEFSSQSAPR